MSSKLLKMSSLTKKFTMALAGLFLIVFLLVHMGINLFIMPIAENHEEVFRAAVEFMTTNPLIEVMENVLMLTFLIHIVLGITLQIQNWMARPTRYAVCQKSAVASPFSRFMIHTGVIIGVFLTIHFINFYFVKEGYLDIPKFGPNPVNGETDFYNMAINLFSMPLYSIFYIVLISGLGFHLHHAFQSAFQSLGLNHPTYTPVIKWAGLIYSVVVTLGFISIPLYFLLIK
jgi:succinate dehydrogenase / fumarate reductase cytochrome b subunit